MALIVTLGVGKLIEEIGETTGINALEKIGQRMSEIAESSIPSALGDVAKDPKNPIKWFMVG
jgi:hypothetical protein